MAVQHPTLAVGGAPGFGAFTQGNQAALFTNNAMRAVVAFAVTPGNLIALSHRWQEAGNRTISAGFDTYDGLVIGNSDGTITVPNGVNLVHSVNFDQTQPPDIAAGLAGASFITGTGGGNPDPNATADDGSSVPYATFYSGMPAQSIVSVVIYKSGLDATDTNKYVILDDFLLQSPDSLAPPLKPVKVNRVTVGPSKRLIIIDVTDLSGSPMGVLSVDNTKLPTLQINGGAGNGNSGSAGTVQLANAMIQYLQDGDHPLLTYVMFPIDFDIEHTDTGTFTCIDSWCNTSLGACAAGTNLPVTNAAGGNILPTPPTPTMGVGTNLSYPASMFLTPCVNLIRQLDDWKDENNNPNPQIQVDANGQVTSIGTALRAVCRVVGGGNQEGDPSQTYVQCRPGVYTLNYVTGGEHILVNNPLIDGTPGPLAILSGPTDNGDGTTTIVYQIGQPAPHYGPIIDLWCLRPGNLISIYPPDPAAPTVRSLDGSSEFHPDFLDKIIGLQCLRLMEASGPTNDSNDVEWDDVAQESNLSYSRFRNREKIAHIIQIEPYVDTQNKYIYQTGTLFLVTTAAPHGIAANGSQFGTLGGFASDSFAVASPSGTIALNGQFTLIDVRSPTTFVFRGPNVAGGTYPQLARTYTTADFGANATVTVQTRKGMPVRTRVAICNANRSAFWLNLGHGITDDCAWNPDDPSRSIFGVVFANLDPALPLYIEYSNEWTFNVFFLQWSWMQQQAALAGTDMITWGIGRTAQLHALATEAAAALGWTGQIIRLFPSQQGNASVATASLTAARAISAPVDAVNTGAYISNFPNDFPGDTELGRACDSFTNDQQPQDVWDAYLTRGSFVQDIRSQRAAIDAFDPNIKLVIYEGAFVDGELASANFSTMARRSRVWSRHWRQFDSFTYFLGNMLQANGVSLFMWFTLSVQPAATGTAMWLLYSNCDQLDGTGNPGENPDSEDFTTNPVSEIGGALHAWAARVASRNNASLPCTPFRSSVFSSPVFRRRSA